MEGALMAGMLIIQPTHFQLGPDATWTPCGLKGIQHRALRYSNDISRVSCRSCRRWFDKKQREEARIAQPRPVNDYQGEKR